jgi:hypothetical protein
MSAADPARLAFLTGFLRREDELIADLIAGRRTPEIVAEARELAQAGRYALKGEDPLYCARIGDLRRVLSEIGIAA